MKAKVSNTPERSLATERASSHLGDADVRDPILGMHRISEVRIRPVPDGSDGLIAFASARYGDLVVNNIAVRRDSSGKLFLTFPRSVSRTGHKHPIVFPLNRETAGQFEDAILGALRRLVGGDGSSS